MLSYLYWIFGFYTEEKVILNVNSYAPTERKFNYVVELAETDDDEPMTDEDNIDEYFRKYYS